MIRIFALVVALALGGCGGKQTPVETGQTTEHEPEAPAQKLCVDIDAVTEGEELDVSSLFDHGLGANVPDTEIAGLVDRVFGEGAEVRFAGTMKNGMVIVASHCDKGGKAGEQEDCTNYAAVFEGVGESAKLLSEEPQQIEPSVDFETDLDVVIADHNEDGTPELWTRADVTPYDEEKEGRATQLAIYAYRLPDFQLAVLLDDSQASELDPEACEKHFYLVDLTCDKAPDLLELEMCALKECYPENVGLGVTYERENDDAGDSPGMDDAGDDSGGAVNPCIDNKPEVERAAYLWDPSEMIYHPAPE